MKKLIKYEGGKTFMFPNGTLATPEAILEQFPAILAFPHVIETDANEEVFWAVENLSAMRSRYEIDPELTEQEAIDLLQDIINAPPPEPPEPGDDPLALALQQLAEVLDGQTEQSEFIEGLMGGEEDE